MDVGGADGIGRSCVLGADGIGRHWTYGIAEPGSLYTASPVVCKRTRNMQHGRWRVRRLATRVTGRILIGNWSKMWNTQLVINTGHVLIYIIHRLYASRSHSLFTRVSQEQDPSRQAENEGGVGSRVHVRPLFVKRWPATNKAGR